VPRAHHDSGPVRPYDVGVNRVWTALLIALTVAVFGGVVYLLGHDTKVPQAGETPGYAPTTEATAAPTTTVPTTPKASTSGVAATSSSAPPSSTLIAFLGDDYTHGVGSSSSTKTFPALIA